MNLEGMEFGNGSDKRGDNSTGNGDSNESVGGDKKDL